MGVRGLLSHIHNTSIRPSTIVLSSETKQKYGSSKAVLVCEFVALVYWFLEMLYNARKDKYVTLYGVDFNECREKLIGFVKALRHIDIEPVFFWCGPRGSGSNSEMKIPIWEERTREVLSLIDSHARIANYDPKTEVKFGKGIDQPLLNIELVLSLKSIDVTIMCTGEASLEMAQYMRDQPNVCGILTNDTDLMLMAECTAIPCKFFDLNNSLKLFESTINKQPSEIHCGIVNPEVLAKHFDIHEKSLPAVAILCGTERIHSMKNTLGLSDVESAIAWIRHHVHSCKSARSFLQIEEIDQVCQKFPRYHSTIISAYHYYSGQHHRTQIDIDCHSPLYDFIVSKTNSLEISRDFLSVVRSGIMWRDSIEQLNDKLPCIHEKMIPVRTIIYRLLCCPIVYEYGQEGVQDFVHCRSVRIATPCYPRDVKMLRQTLSPQQKLAILHHVLKTHKLTKDVSSLLAIPPMECPIEDLGPLITCLSFMYFHRRRLIPSEDYITPLLLACFHCSLGLSPPRLSARPGPTGITTASQFMMVLQHIQWILSLLGINDEFPFPSTIFQPYVYIPLHGTAFKLNVTKEKFHGNDLLAKEHFVSLSTNRVFDDLKRCICDGRAIDHVGIVVRKYKETRDELKKSFEKKQRAAELKEKKVSKN